MYSCLFKWCNHGNRDIKKLAFPALEAFLQQVELFTYDHVIQLVIFYCVLKVSTYILQEDDSRGNEEMFRV